MSVTQTSLEARWGLSVNLINKPENESRFLRSNMQSTTLYCFSVMLHLCLIVYNNMSLSIEFENIISMNEVRRGSKFVPRCKGRVLFFPFWEQTFFQSPFWEKTYGRKGGGGGEKISCHSSRELFPTEICVKHIHCV